MFLFPHLNFEIFVYDLFNKRRKGVGALAATGILRTEKWNCFLFPFSFIFYDYLKFFVHAYAFQI